MFLIFLSSKTGFAIDTGEWDVYEPGAGNMAPPEWNAPVHRQRNEYPLVRDGSDRTANTFLFTIHH